MGTDWLLRLRRAALQGALLGAASACDGGRPLEDAGVVPDAGGGVFDAGPPCTERLPVTLFDGGSTSFEDCGAIRVECEPVPDGGVCPNRMATARVGPFASAGSSTGCCYVQQAFGRPLLGEAGPLVAPLVVTTSWV
jgi:hypothetical protein